MRKPIVAGMFYESVAKELSKQIDSCFFHKLGPGDLPVKRKERILLGILSPHASYRFSGPCQAWAYKELAESRFAKTYVILGPNHSGTGKDIAVSSENWDTPLGVVRTDKAFIRDLLEKSKGLVVESNMAHEQEHSIEVQLPFLQYACKDRVAEIKIVPLVIRKISYDACKRLAKLICSISKDIVVIASSDLIHFGSNYGFKPFTFNIKEGVKGLDYGAIDFINNVDAQGFLNYVTRTKATICGSEAIAVMLECVKNFGGGKGNLLRYYTSADLKEGDYSNSVSYCSMSFY